MAVSIEHSLIPSNGIQMHVASCGPVDAQPIILLHGFPEGWMSWRPIMERLGETWRCIAPDLRGYGSTDHPADGYDPLSLTDDVMGLALELNLRNPILVGHDWGGALAWFYGHRYGKSARHIVVVNCTHPKTLFRGILQRRGQQHRRSWYILAFQMPGLPEHAMTAHHARLLRQSFLRMEGRKGAMDRAAVNELCDRFRLPDDLRGPVNYYRTLARMQVDLEGRRALQAIYAQPIACPVTLVWGDRDRALSAEVAQDSHLDAHCDVEWRPLPGVGHFVSLEAPDELAAEIRRVAEPPAA